MATLVFTAEAMLAWKIAVVAYGSEGLEPSTVQECPYFCQYGTESSCVSGSGGSMCGGFMGSTAGYVYCVWGLN